MQKQNILVGRTLTGMKIADDKEALLFQTTEGDVIVGVDADCCSHTWIEAIEFPSRGFPAVVLAVEDLDMPDLGDMPNCEVVAYYGCKITTDSGDVVIDYRNDSNGYYGGSLTWPGDYHYGGVHGQNNSAMKWQEIAK